MFEIELLIFILDGSGSMKEKKANLLASLVKGVLKRLESSATNETYRAALIYFATDALVEKEDEQIYLDLTTAIEKIKNPYERLLRDVIYKNNPETINPIIGNTNIFPVLTNTLKILIDFQRDNSLPSDKRATVFLFTDGHFHDLDNEAQELINQIHSHPISPTMATIAFGEDAKFDDLMEMASETNDRQKRHLEIAQVLNHLPNSEKLFLMGHEGDEITESKIEAIRNFLNTLTQTA